MKDWRKSPGATYPFRYMYKKSTKYAARHPEVVKRAAGFPQTDQLVQQRRKATPGNPIVPTTESCIYCGRQLPKRVRALQDQIREINGELQFVRSLLTISQQRKLLDFHKYFTTKRPLRLENVDERDANPNYDRRRSV